MSVKINKGNAAGLVNLTPMIDVVFQLLLFFIVVSKFADSERALKVVLPQASEAKPITAKPTEFFVNVDEQGRYFVGGRFLSRTELEQSLQQVSAGSTRQSVVIRADKRCEWEHVVFVMNACNKANIRDYQVSTADKNQ